MANVSSGGVISTLSKLVHLIAVLHFYYGLYYDMRYVFPPENHPLFHKISSWGGKFRYLTILGAIWQTFYFTLCVLNDFIGTNEYHPKRPSKLRQLKDYVFATFAFPLAMTVAISFWAIYAVDRELILPKAMESFFPSWLNHVMHTNILIFVFLELILSFRQYPIRKSGVTGLTLFMIGYLIWIHIIKYMSGRWVYPILEVLNLPMRIVFLVFNGAFGVSFYFVGEFLNNKIWATELKSAKSSGKKHK